MTLVGALLWIKQHGTVVLRRLRSAPTDPAICKAVAGARLGRWESVTMLSQLFSRSTDIFPKRLGISTYYSFLCHSQFLSCKVCQLRVSHLKGSVQANEPVREG
jgi:hypothetical protein